MSSILPDVVDATWTAASADAGTPAGTVVLRAAGLRVHGGTVTAAGDAAPAAGELAVFCRPVVTAPAVVRRDGTVLADAWLPDLVRLGELERHLGDGVIEAAVDAAIAEGRLKPRQRRRIMSYPLVIRLMIAMDPQPGGTYCEALARLAGLLADIPFAREWHFPTGKVVTDWRLPVPAEVTETSSGRQPGRSSAMTRHGRQIQVTTGPEGGRASNPGSRLAERPAGGRGEGRAGAAHWRPAAAD